VTRKESSSFDVLFVCSLLVIASLLICTDAYLIVKIVERFPHASDGTVMAASFISAALYYVLPFTWDAVTMMFEGSRSRIKKIASLMKGIRFQSVLLIFYFVISSPLSFYFDYSIRHQGVVVSILAALCLPFAVAMIAMIVFMIIWGFISALFTDIRTWLMKVASFAKGKRMDDANKTTIFPTRVILTNYERLVLWDGDRAMAVLMDGMPIPSAAQKLLGRYENIRWTESKVFSRGPYVSEHLLRGSIRTADGVSLTGQIKIEWLIRDSSDAILRVLRYEDRETEVLTKQVVTVLQEIVIKQSYDEFFAARLLLAKSIEASLSETKWAALRTMDPQQIYLIDLDAADTAVRESLASHLRLKRDEKYRIAEAESLTLQAKADAQRQIAEAETARKIKELQVVQDIELDSQRERARLKLLSEKAELLTTEAGRMAEDMPAMLAYNREMKKIEAEILVLQKSIEDSRLKTLAGFQAGQIQVLAQVAARNYQINLGTNPMIEGGGGETEEGKPQATEEKKDTEKSK